MASKAKRTQTKDVDALTAIDLDALTTRELLRMHVDRICQTGDPGELELIAQFFHFLHARRYGRDPDMIETRYNDFKEQLEMVLKS